jgi:hypothetical protein
MMIYPETPEQESLNRWMAEIHTSDKVRSQCHRIVREMKTKA